MNEKNVSNSQIIYDFTISDKNLLSHLDNQNNFNIISIHEDTAYRVLEGYFKKNKWYQLWKALVPAIFSILILKTTIPDYVSFMSIASETWSQIWTLILLFLSIITIISFSFDVLYWNIVDRALSDIAKKSINFRDEDKNHAVYFVCDKNDCEIMTL